MANDTGPVPQWLINKYGTTAKQAGDKYGVDYNVILSVIWTESSGDPNAPNRSDNGLQIGLMQLSPAAWNEATSVPWTSGGSTNDEVINGDTSIAALNGQYDSCVRNATYNIFVGTKYIAMRSYKRFNYPGSEDTIQSGLAGFGDGTSTYVPIVEGNAQKLQQGIVAAGSEPAYANNIPTQAQQANNPAKDILNFAQFAETLAFKTAMMSAFERSMEDTLHGYLSKFMAKFYHSLYYVPTLPDNFAILVKPECCFVEVPACNVVYPTLKDSISFNRNPKIEPTRIIMISNPVSNVFGATSSPITQLVTMVFIDEEVVDGVTRTITRSISNLNADKDKLRYPMRMLTKFEEKNGIRILRDARGEDLYLYLVSNNSSRTDSKTSAKYYVLADGTQQKAIAETLEKLARYSLLRARYEPRSGSCTMFANPYIVPGLPMLSVEGEDDSSMNLYAYVESVTQSITESSWTTHVSFSNTHIATEPRPEAFPIAESQYTETIDDTYKKMLGPAMTKLDKNTGAKDVRAAYNTSDKSVTSMLKRIWRPLTTREQHLTTICDGATVQQSEYYTWFQNGEGKKFFNTTTQDKVKAYTEGIMKGNALIEADVR